MLQGPPQQCAVVEGQLLLHVPERKAEIMPFVDAGVVACPYCRGSLGWDDEGFRHIDQHLSHPPLDMAWHQHVINLHDRLKRLFPTAHLARYAPIAGQVVEIVLLTLQGGKLGVLMPGSVEDYERLPELHALMIQHGVKPLIILPDHLVTLTQPKRSKTSRIKLETIALAVLALGEPLWLSTLNKRILHVIPHPGTKPLWTRGKSLGVVEAAVREYPLSQLRVSSGMMIGLSEWDPPLPDFAPLPARLIKKL